MQFYIEDMTCGGCAKAVTKAILLVDPAAKVTADPVSHLVEIDTSAPRAKLEATLSEAGYTPAAP